MVKYTQTIRRQQSVFDHFVGLALKGLKTVKFLRTICGITPDFAFLFSAYFLVDVSL